MILADTSLWVAHARHGHEAFSAVLSEGRVLVHPFVLAELALGGFFRTRGFERLVGSLPVAPAASHDEVMALVHATPLVGARVGWVDAHLIAAALLARAALATTDVSLRRAAGVAGVQTDWG